MKNAIVMFSLMGLMFAGCDTEGYKEHKEGEKNGEMKKEMPGKMMNGQDKMMNGQDRMMNGQDRMQSPGMEK